MDVGMYHCTQELCTYLHKVIQRSVESLFSMVYESSTTPSIQKSSWAKVVRGFPKEFRNESLDPMVKNLYKKTMGVYVHNVLKRKDVVSIVGTRTFIDMFMESFLNHPRMQHNEGGPKFFIIDNYSSQRRLIMDVLRTTLSEISSKLHENTHVPPGYSALVAGGNISGKSSRLGEQSAMSVQRSVKDHVVRSELPRIRQIPSVLSRRSVASSVKNVDQNIDNQAKSIHLRNLPEGIKRSVSVATASVVPDDSVSCAPRRLKSTNK